MWRPRMERLVAIRAGRINEPCCCGRLSLRDWVLTSPQRVKTSEWDRRSR